MASEKQKIPLDKYRFSGQAAAFEAFLLEHIKGQERPIREIVSAYDQFRTGFRDRDRPIISMLSVGPSGTGKTLLAEVMAEFFFGSRSKFCKISCPSFSESHKVSALTGSPPGYIGFIDSNKEDPTLSPYPFLSKWNIDKYDFFAKKGKNMDEKIAKLRKEAKNMSDKLKKIAEELIKLPPNSPKYLQSFATYVDFKQRYEELCGAIKELGYNPDDDYLSIVLFDELDRAHPTVHDIILEITDKAKLSLSDGRVTSFSNTFLLMTANINERGIASLMKGVHMGFQGKEGSNTVDEQIYKTTDAEVKKILTAPFLGRLDSVEVFRPLTMPIIREILDYQLAQFQNMLSLKFPVLLHIDESVKDFILEEATDQPEQGARLLKKKIQKHIKQWLSRLAASGQIGKGDVVYVTLQGRETIFFKEEPNKDKILLA